MTRDDFDNICSRYYMTPKENNEGDYDYCYNGIVIASFFDQLGGMGVCWHYSTDYAGNLINKDRGEGYSDVKSFKNALDLTMSKSKGAKKAIRLKMIDEL